MTDTSPSRLHRDTADQIAAVPSSVDRSEGELVVNSEEQTVQSRDHRLQDMSAVISQCGKHRLRLDRVVDPLLDGIVAALIGVNPSVANATMNDPTIRKDMGFARRLGWRHIIKGNEFTYRATDVRELATCAEPNHPDADEALRQIFADADVLVPCWGPLAKLPKHLRGRWREVSAMMAATGKPVMCLGTALDGQPRHTLMLPYTTPLVEWSLS